MTVAFDAATEFSATFTTTSPATQSHSPVGTPRGVIVEIDHGSVSDDLITGVTYGGVAMARVATAQDPSTEPGRSYLYFLGANIPTGTQTVSISHTATATVKHAAIATVTAAGDTEIGAAGGIDPETANPLVYLGNGDNSGLAFGVIYSGDTNVGVNATLLSGMTAIHDHDFGNFSSRFDRQTTAATGAFVFGYTIGVDDVALCAVSIIEQRTGAYAKGSTAPFLQTTTTSFVIQIAGELNGMDLYVLAVSRDHTSVTALPTCTDNSGGNTWTLLGNTTDRKALVWWKKGAIGDIGADITVAGCVGSATGGFLVIKGALASGDPTTQLVFEDNASGDETHAGFTPTNAASVVVFGVFDVANDTNAVTDLAGATMGSLEPEFLERLSSGGNDSRITVTARTLASGATGNFTWTQADSTTKSVSFAAQPEVAGPEEGQGAVAVAVAVSATGHPIHKGSANVAVAVAISGTGKATHKGQANVAVAVVISATGEKPPKEGQGAVDVTVAIQGSGHAVKQGSGSVAVAVAISGTGTPIHKGQGAVAVGVAISATGTPTHKGQADVPVAVTISGTGHALKDGQADISVAVSISATGLRIAQGQAAVAADVAISATGHPTHKAQADVPVNVLIVGTGQIAGATPSGQGAVAVGVLIVATGEVTHKGQASVAVGVAISGTGVKPPKEGQAAVVVGVLISATGKGIHQGQAAVLVGVAISGTGQIPSLIVLRSATSVVGRGSASSRVLVGSASSQVGAGTVSSEVE